MNVLRQKKKSTKEQTRSSKPPRHQVLRCDVTTTEIKADRMALQCKTCGQVFVSQRCLDDHEHFLHGKTLTFYYDTGAMYPDGMTPKDSSSFTHDTYHERRQYERAMDGTYYRCRHCGEVFADIVERSQHERRCRTPSTIEITQHRRQRYNCSKCDRYRELLPGKDYCEQCTLSATPNHSNECDIDKDVTVEHNCCCTTCDDSFETSCQLIQHRRSVHAFGNFICPHCTKTFVRIDNFNRHMKCHEDNRYHQCDACGKCFTNHEDLIKHNGQRGGGKRLADNEGSEQSKRIRIETPKDHYELTFLKENYSKKFRTTTKTYSVSFKNLEVTSLPDILASLKQILGSIIQELTAKMQGNDLIQLSLQSPTLDFPIMIPFVRKCNLTPDTLLSEIERVLQSHEEFVLDSGVDISVNHVSVPDGEGKRTGYVDLEKYLTEKRCIIRIQNNDDICMARALVTAQARLDKHEKWNSIRLGRSIQKEMALDLHARAGVPVGPCGIDELKLFQMAMPDYQLNLISSDYFNAFIYTGPDSDNKIYLYHHNKHYDVITSMPAFINRSYFCVQCNKGYTNIEKHACNNVCHCCLKIHDFDGNAEWILCNVCNRYFKGRNCFKNHEILTEMGNSTCTKMYRCKKCDKTVNASAKRHHVCGEIFCKTCYEYHPTGHKCFMKPVISKITQGNHSTSSSETDKDETRYIFYDFECTQDNGIHKPNLCVAHRVCGQCIDSECEICDNCGQREMVFSGEDTRDNFCKWLFSLENNGSICIAHNSKAYDSIFILKYLHDNSKLPKVIMNGTKLMSIFVQDCNIKLIDSINFLPMALSKLPSAFGFEELEKGHFPHIFNQSINQDIILPNLPDAKYYSPDTMRPKERQKFYEWYNSNYKSEFDMQKELKKYCISDVHILRKACVEFRSLFMKVTSEGVGDPGIDPFKQCVTIASACNLVYRTKFLKPQTIAVIPPLGYHPEQKQSLKAIQWLKYLANKEGVRIQHAKNGREVQIGPYRVDGYYERDGKRVCLEFQGCLFHGCINCYTRDTVNPINEKTMRDLYTQTIEKRKYIEAEGYVYIEKWECQWDREVKESKEISEFVDSLELIAPLEPRDAFYGGRTEGFKLYKEIDASKNEKIKYLDFTSLYPYINKYTKYPIGHPIIITENFADLSTYEGLIKCKILPPQDLYIPLLPSKINGKLLFPLCRTCATEQNKECTHSLNERALTGTWTTDEIRKAIELGYKVLRVYEIWHFVKTAIYDPNTKTGGLFTDYVNTFLKLKTEASDFPKLCTLEKSKQEYIDRYLEKEGVQLDMNRITSNPGLRVLSKLILNSFWGKFGQRTNMTKTVYISDPKQYFDLLTSDQNEVRSIRLINEEIVEVQWSYKNDFVEPASKTNVVIAAYTTANARLKLYSVLESLDRRVLYVDTDSVVYETKPGAYEPNIGEFLGDLSDQLESDFINIWVCGGPKNYAYRTSKPDSDGNITHCKIRGITLNYKNTIDINFDTVRKMVRGVGPEKVTVVDDRKITRDMKNVSVVNKVQEKDYRIVFDKRVIVNNYETLPYGYIKS